MTESTEIDQKEQAAAWDKQCNKVALKYFAVVLPLQVLLMVPFITTLQYFLEVTGPLVSGELAYGQPGHNEFQAAKDLALILLAVLLVVTIAVYYFGHRWWKKSMRALGRRPGGYTGRWKRWIKEA